MVPARQEPPPQDVDPEESRRRTEQHHQDRIAQAKAELVDRAWASSTEASLQADLARFAEDPGAKGMTAVKVECRTTQCLAVMEWPSFEAARGGYGDILHGRYQANCGREVLLPPPANPSARYQATVVYDCTEARAGNDNPSP
jgi:hypothetical protein